MTIKQEKFETSDFALSVFLYAKGVPLLTLRPSNFPRKFYFVFQTTPDLTSLVDAFWTGSEKIEPLRLLNAEKELKRRLYSDSYQTTHNLENK